MRRKRVHHLAGRHARGDGLGVGKVRQAGGEVVRQIAEHAMPRGDLFRRGAGLPAFKLLLPRCLRFTALFDGLTVELHHVAGDQKGRFERPAERFFGGLDLIRAEWLAVRLGGPGLVRAAVADGGADHDQRRPAGFRLGGADRCVDGVDVVAVRNALDVPVVGREARADVFGKRHTRAAFNRDVVVVVEVDQLAQLEMPGQ